jgi:hypothetical protein
MGGVKMTRQKVFQLTDGRLLAGKINKRSSPFSKLLSLITLQVDNDFGPLRRLSSHLALSFIVSRVATVKVVVPLGRIISTPYTLVLAESHT